MASIVVAGDTSGTVTLAAPSVAGTTTLTLPTANGTVITTGSSGQSIPKAALPTGSVLQVVNSLATAVATGTTALPNDNSIPQNTEGTEFITATITPTSSSSKLIIFVNMFCSVNSTVALVVALFQDSTANALAAVSAYEPTSTGEMSIPLQYYMTAGTTSATTFKVRCGTSGGNTVTVNGSNGARLFGGVGTSSITIMEIAA